MFYTYNQNNSYGRFYANKDRGISHYVIVEADTCRQADAKAQDIGLYFNGCDSGLDCQCCGDRWSTASDYWGDSKGYPVPSIYGTPITKATTYYRDWEDTHGAAEVYVHYKDGRVVPVTLMETRGVLG